MLELRVTADGKRLAAMRDAIARECERAKAGAEHGVAVARLVEHLVGSPETGGGRGRRMRRRGDVFVIVTVQSDATMIILRDTRPEPAGLGAPRQAALEEQTSSWSTMSGRDGRTIWAEVARAVPPPVPRRPAAQPVRPAPPLEPVATRV